ncbi:hypothetical protein M0813_00861 [Anaeramoeba flamelloides]|uniref:BTB domain-containing protein n=1 Tax=Anaeramoeba flamelloides TaxID=1746091 RepID=A0ABQ8XFE6_9EUKA|nr:hypothetical protein M0813_00861 [Anaeramoeba flamelloides]
MSFRSWCAGKNTNLIFPNNPKRELILQTCKYPKVQQMCGSSNTLISTNDENLFSTTGNYNFTSDLFQKTNDPVIKLYCGYYHHLIATESGRVFCMGGNNTNQFPNLTNGTISELTEQTFFKKNNLKVIDFSGGEYHSLFLCDNGELYGLGDNSYFQLESNPSTIQKKEVPVHSNKRNEVTLLSENVKLISNGLSNRHTLYITEDNTLWTQGWNNYMQCGVESTKQKVETPTIIKYLDTKNINKMCTGFELSVIMIDNSEIYTAGYNLSNGHDIKVSAFTKLKFFNNIPIKQISTGSRHCLVLAEDNKLYGFGEGKCSLPFHNSPREIELPEYDFDQELAIGSCCYSIFIYTAQNTGVIKDFQNLYESQEFTDYQINEVKVHKSILEFRLDIKIEKAQEILKQYTKKELDIFLRWVYFDKIIDKELILSICDKFGISSPNEKNLKNDLIKLYKDEDSKNFNVLVKDEDYDDENDEDDEDEQSGFEEIPVHKFILLARSGLFREMFKNINENEKNINKITDYSKKSIESLEILFKYFYTNTIELTADDDPILIVEELSDATEYYQLAKFCNLNGELKKIQSQFKI